MNAGGDAARESARQSNGEFGTQPLADVSANVDLAAPPAREVATDSWTGRQYMTNPDPLMAMSEHIERARDHWFDHMAVYDVLETVENSGEDDFEPEDAAYALISDDRDDDDDRCSMVTFYDAQGVELVEVMQAGYTVNSVPAHFTAVNAPGEAGQYGAVDMAKVRDFDWEKLGVTYAKQLREAADDFDRNRTAIKYAAFEAREAAKEVAEDICSKCGSPADAPDPTCSMCPKSDRVACYAGNCTYIATDEDDLDKHVSTECQHQDNSEGHRGQGWR